MKKIAVLFILSALSACLFAENIPAFDNAKAAVFDVNVMPGKAKNGIRVINATHEDNLNVAVSVYDAKQKNWVPYGTALLRSLTDAVSVDSAMKSKLKDYQYVAAVPSSEKEFKVLAKKEDNNLCISVLSLEEPSEYATVMDVFALNGTFKSKVVLENHSSARNVGFDVYTQKDNSDTWFKVGVAYLKDKGDSCAVMVVTPDAVESYRYFAVIAHDGVDYAYSAKKADNALVITVQ